VSKGYDADNLWLRLTGFRVAFMELDRNWFSLETLHRTGRAFFNADTLTGTFGWIDNGQFVFHGHSTFRTILLAHATGNTAYTADLFDHFPTVMR
jgi:hypothetical protein